MRKLLPWSFLLAALLAAIPVVSEFTPTEVANKIITWKSVSVFTFTLFLLVNLVRFVILYIRPSPSGTVSQHDVQLFGRINEVLNDGALTFLADHDFHNDCHVGNLKPIETVSYWHGPNFMFSDKAVQKRWENLFKKILRLCDVYGSNLTNSEDNVERMTAWHLGFPKNAQPPQAHKEVQELNDAAHDVYREFGVFAPYARSRLRL